MTETLIKKDVIIFLSGVHITEGVIRKVRNETLLKLMPRGPELDKILTNTREANFRHISYLTSDKLWVNDGKRKLSLINKTGDDEYHLSGNGIGFHTVNNKGELFYIDSSSNISKLLKDLKTPAIFIQTIGSKWKPLCVYWCSFTGELLVGMRAETKDTFKVNRYNRNGQLNKTVHYNNTKQKVCQYPRFLTVNKNLDIVVSGPGAIVVTEQGGKHRFSYTGYPSGSDFSPQGICTDALSHILVCERKGHTVQILDEDGYFLSHLLMRPPGIFYPYSLSYDAKTHRLLVGSWDMICVYRYITRQDFFARKITYLCRFRNKFQNCVHDYFHWQFDAY